MSKERAAGIWRNSARHAIFCLLILITTSCHVVNVKYSPTARSARAELKVAVERLFYSYEVENAAEFVNLISSEFHGADNSGYAYNAIWLEQAVRDDFRNLDNPEFQGIVDSVLADENGNLHRIRVRWFRRAYVPYGGEEWLVSGQESVLLFRREADGAWKLCGLEGAPIFGLSDQMGVIQVRQGTVKGILPAATARIEHGRYHP